MSDAHDNPEAATAATKANASPELFRIHRCGIALTHVAGAAGPHPSDAMMSLSYALGTLMGNYVKHDEPEVVEELLTSVHAEVTRIYRLILQKRHELDAAGATQQ